MVLMVDPHPPYRGGTPCCLTQLVRYARMQLESVRVAADVPRIRDDMIDTLIKAITEANMIAKLSLDSADKGTGGVPPKARWYQLVGYLVQVLDGVCKNVELSEINERLLKVEKALGVAKAGAPQARRKS
jgi:hypothetical protein